MYLVDFFFGVLLRHKGNTLKERKNFMKMKQMKQCLRTKKEKVGFWLTTIAVAMGNKAIVYADTDSSDDKKIDIDFLKQGGNGAFAGLNKTIKNTGSSAFPMFMTIGVVAILAALTCAAIGLLFGNTNKKEESKSRIFWICVAGVIIFGSTGIIGILKGIGISIK